MFSELIMLRRGRKRQAALIRLGMFCMLRFRKWCFTSHVAGGPVPGGCHSVPRGWVKAGASTCPVPPSSAELLCTLRPTLVAHLF